MIYATTMIDKFAHEIGGDPKTFEQYWRYLREAELVPSGRRGNKGQPADVGALEVVRLVEAYLSGEGVRSAPEAVRRIGAARSVSPTLAGAGGTFEDELVKLVTGMTRYQATESAIEVFKSWKNAMTHVGVEVDFHPNKAVKVASVALVRNATGVEWAEIRYFVGSEIKRKYDGGMHDYSMRDIFVADGVSLDIEDLRKTAHAVRETCVHGIVFYGLRNIIEGAAQED